MIQPGRDEISQGMEHRHLAPYLRGRRALIAAGSAAALLIGAISITTAVVVSGPSYPYAWCRPLLTAVHVRGKSDLGYAAVLVRLRSRDHAPVTRLLSDLDDYSVASSVGLDQNNVTPTGSAAGMTSTFTAVKSDLQALNRDCGQPPDAYQSDSF